MRFKKWVEDNYPSFEKRLDAIYDELVSGASVVDIDYASSTLSIGCNKRPEFVKTNTAKSKGRCRVYINVQSYDDLDFPVVVFVNMRASFSDSGTGRSVPAVVNGVNILFEAFKNNTLLKPSKIKKELIDQEQPIDRVKLVNEARSWFSKFKPLSSSSDIAYFKSKGLDIGWLHKQSNLNIREHYASTYGRFDAIPLRYPHQNTFEGFQRIYSNGRKIMMKGFNPNGLCAYFPSEQDSEDAQNVKTVIITEGIANALMQHRMSQDIGLSSVVNLAALYLDNIPLLVKVLKDSFVNCNRFLLIRDNDIGDKSQVIAANCQEILPILKVETLSLNDICAVVKVKGYDVAKIEFKQKIMSAFSA